MWTSPSPSQSSSSLSVSATGKRQQLTVGSDKYTQLINHYRSSPHSPLHNSSKKWHKYRFTQKLQNYKKDRQVAPGLGTCPPTPRCDSRRQAIHQFVQRQLRVLPLLVTSPPHPPPLLQQVTHWRPKYVENWRHFWSLYLPTILISLDDRTVESLDRRRLTIDAF